MESQTKSLSVPLDFVMALSDVYITQYSQRIFVFSCNAKATKILPRQNDESNAYHVVHASQKVY